MRPGSYGPGWRTPASLADNAGTAPYRFAPSDEPQALDASGIPVG